jgi:uncharacterized membrane protein
MIGSVLRFISLVFTGLFAGFLVGILVLELSLRGFDGSVYTQTQRVALVALPLLATVLLVPAMITTGATAASRMRARDRVFRLAAGAFALLLAAFVVTLAVNVPINLAEGDWAVGAPPADWAAIRDRWQIGHAVRTVAAVAAFCLLAAAAPAGRAHPDGRVR